MIFTLIVTVENLTFLSPPPGTCCT